MDAKEMNEILSARKFLESFGVYTENMSDEDVQAKMKKIQEHKQVAVQVLSRGQVTDSIEKILDTLPDGIVGEFVSNDDLSISRAQAMGWEVYVDGKASKKSLTPSADGRVILGDQILVVMSDEKYIANALVRRERKMARRKRHNAKTVNQSVVNSDDPDVPQLRELAKLGSSHSSEE